MRSAWSSKATRQPSLSMETKVSEFTGHAPHAGSFFGFLIYFRKDDHGPWTVTLKSILAREVAGQ